MDDSSGRSLIHLLKASYKQTAGAAPETANEILDRLDDFFDTAVSEVMVPRTDMTSIEGNVSIQDALALHHKTGFTRMPVFEGRRDNVTGILHVVDLVPYMLENRLREPVQEAMRPVHFVGYSQPIYQVMESLREAHTHMAVVVDEYGGVDGIITLTDILAELVGYMPDEFDNPGLDQGFHEIEDGMIIMDANFDLDEFNEMFHTRFEKEGIETIGGYTCHVLGKIPSQAERFEIANIPFVVEEGSDRRLMKLRLPAPRKFAS